MSVNLSDYGLRAADAPYLKSFESAASQLGWSDREIAAALNWYRVYFQPGAERPDIETSFRYVMARSGMSEERIEDALFWHAAVEQGGPRAIRPLPASAEHADRKRLGDIRRIARQDPNAYDRDPSMQREHIDILERLGPAEPVAALPAPRLEE